VVNAILRIVYLKSLVINFVSVPTYVNLANLVFGMFNFSFFFDVVSLSVKYHVYCYVIYDLLPVPVAARSKA
jgi:hypothetical protein